MVGKAVTIFVTCSAIIVGIIWYSTYLPLSPKIGGPSSKIIPFVLKCGEQIGFALNMLGIGESRIKIIRAVLAWADSPLLDFGQDEWKNGVNIEDAIIAGVPVIVFRPTTQVSTPPVLIHFHGGGLTFGSPTYKGFMSQCVLLADGTKSVVISVDYRLAPENTFPAQFNDGLAVVSAVMNEPMKFGVDGNKIALAGDSAGGLLSAAISLEFAKQARLATKIVAQVLIYPWVQNIDVLCLPSYKEYSEGFVMSSEVMAYYASASTMGNSSMIPEYLVGNVSRYFMQTAHWKYIAEASTCEIPTEKSIINLPPDFVEKVTDPRLSPLLAEDLHGSPPTFVAIAEYDVLASEGKLFAKRLKVAGVQVVVKQYKTYHAFMQNIGLPNVIRNDTLARVAINDMISFLNSVLYENHV